jgi:hypothetical protein
VFKNQLFIQRPPAKFYFNLAGGTHRKGLTPETSFRFPRFHYIIPFPTIYTFNIIVSFFELVNDQSLFSGLLQPRFWL